MADDRQPDDASLGAPLARLALSDAEQEALDAWSVTFLDRAWPRMGLLLAAAAVLWWPTDLWLFEAGSPERLGLGVLRSVSAPLNVVLAVFGRRIPWVRAHAMLTLGVVMVVEAALAGYAVGLMGERWQGFLYLVPVFSALLPVPPGPRVVAVAAMWATAWLSFVLTLSGPWSTPVMSGALFSLFGCLLAIAIGHLLWASMMSAWISRHRLGVLASSLQTRVDAQTRTLRTLLSQVDASREDERKTLARELHDELGQELSALRITVALGRSRPGPALWDEVHRLLDRTGDAVRRMLVTLRPRALDELGLSGGLRWLAEQTERRGLPCEVVVPDEVRLSPATEQALFRCAQEALTNTVRHANATRARVRLTLTAGVASLEVSDDGVGIAPDDMGQRGLGLVGIAERARALGGSADWTSDRGTRLRVDLPVGAP